MAPSLENMRVDELFDELERLLITCDHEYVRARAYRLLRQVKALECNAAEASMDADAVLVRKATSFMEAHLGVRLTVEQVASACGTSTSMLKQAFRNVHGMPPATWWRKRRMCEAQRLLLETSFDVTQVALAVGYANPSKFSRAFKGHAGLTPTEWRAAHR